MTSTDKQGVSEPTIAVTAALPLPGALRRAAERLRLAGQIIMVDAHGGADRLRENQGVIEWLEAMAAAEEATYGKR